MADKTARQVSVLLCKKSLGNKPLRHDPKVWRPSADLACLLSVINSWDLPRIEAWIVRQHGETVWRDKGIFDNWSGGSIWDDAGKGLAGAKRLLAAEQGNILVLKIEFKSLDNTLEWHFFETEVRFKILSAAQTKALDADLLRVGGAPELLKHVLRARVFAKYEMYNQVADEYEEALKLAPDNRPVLDTAISACHRIGNVLREDELLSREENAGGGN
jgi:hypothetical protein